MGSELRLRRVRLEPANPHHSWEFPNGVTVIVGASGGGKTQLLNLIQLGLGMVAPLVEEVTRAADAVTLDVEAGVVPRQLTRRFGENRVDVTDGVNTKRTYTMDARVKKLPLLGDWLLERLGIPAVRLRQSRASRSNKLTRISFADVFAYCYLDQNEVDRSTVYDNDEFRGPKRASTFELLYGIIDAQVANLEVEQLELKSDAEKRSARVKAVQTFVREKDLAATAEAIDIRLANIAEEQSRLGKQLTQARADAERAAESVSELPQSITATEHSLSAVEQELTEVMQELHGVQRAANQLDRDLQALRDGADTESVLSTFPFVTCPRCEQPLDRRAPPEGHCVVCMQADLPARADQGDGLADQLMRQRAETRALESRLAGMRDAIRNEIGELRGELKRQRAELRRAIKAAAAPHAEAAQRITERVGALRGEQTVLTQTRPVAAAVEQERQEIAAIAPRVEELADREHRRREALAPARERVGELSGEFDVILHRFTLPWLETAEVDHETYLPRGNSRSLTELSSGGMKTTTNVAYYLASLVTALRDPEVLTPSFLMLDSIRKASGGETRDLARAEHIYTYLRTLQDSRNNPGALRADFHLFVVDNDLPMEYEKAFNVLRIDPDHPLVRLD